MCIVNISCDEKNSVYISHLFSFLLEQNQMRTQAQAWTMNSIGILLKCLQRN